MGGSSSNADDAPSNIFLNEADLGYREAFEIFDINGDHTISKKELKTVYRSLGLSDNNLDKDFEMYQYQSNKRAGAEQQDTEIEYRMFKKLLEAKLKESPLNIKIANAFSVFDKEGKNIISKNQIHYLLSNLGDPLTKEEVEEFFMDLEKDGIEINGSVEYNKLADKMVE